MDGLASRLLAPNTAVIWLGQELRTAKKILARPKFGSKPNDSQNIRAEPKFGQVSRVTIQTAP